LSECKHGFHPKTCWIADVKAEHGLASFQAPNRLSGMSREQPCPPDKRLHIEAALHHFGMI
jgi:hypothetical protein